MDDLISSIQIEEKYREKNKTFHAPTISEIDLNTNVVQNKNLYLKRKKFKKGETSNNKKYAPWKK